MPNQSFKEGKRYLKVKSTQKRKVASPVLRETRDQMRRNEFGGRTKALSANRLPRVAQLQKGQSKMNSQENAQPYYMGKDGEILSGQLSSASMHAPQVSSQDEDDDISPYHETEDSREEPYVGNVFQAFWMSVSRLFNGKATTSVDEEDTLSGENAPLQSSSAEDQRPCSSNDRGSNQMGPSDWRRPGLGRSVSQTSGPHTRDSWRRRQYLDAYNTYVAGLNSKTNRKPRLSKEEMLAKREKRVKKSGSPVDPKKFRVVLTKLQNVLKEESKRLGVDSRLAAQGLGRTKSLVLDPSHAPSRPSSYGPKSLSSLHQQGNDPNKANTRVNGYMSRRSVVGGLRNAIRSDAASDRPKFASVPASLNSDILGSEADGLARSKSTQIALANMSRFRSVVMKSNEAQCDADSSPCKAQVQMPSSFQTEPDPTQNKEASVQFPSSSSSNRNNVQSDAEVSELSFVM